MQDVLDLDRLVSRLVWQAVAVAAVLSRSDIAVPVEHSPAGYSSTMAVARHSCSSDPYLALMDALVAYCWVVETIHCPRRQVLAEEDLEEACSMRRLHPYLGILVADRMGFALAVRLGSMVFLWAAAAVGVVAAGLELVS